MDKSDVCPDESKQAVMQKPKLSAGTNLKRRYKPSSNSLGLLGSILELITDPGDKTFDDAIDRCFRLNGELMTMPQNENEDIVLDKIFWNFMLKKASNNLTEINKKSAPGTFLAAKTKEQSVGNMFDSRQLRPH